MTTVQDNLLAFARSLTSNEHDAEDLFQETLFKALKYRRRYTPKTNLKAWLFTIMKNTFINDYRRQVKWRSIHKENQGTASGKTFWHTAPETPEGHVSVTDIEREMDRLSNEVREPFQMYLDGYAYKDIADELKIPIGTVKSRIFGARRQLMKALKDYKNV